LDEARENFDAIDSGVRGAYESPGRHNKFQINDTALTLTDIKLSIAMSRRRDSRRQTSSDFTEFFFTRPADKILEREL
jgi:hypothetical protein